MSYPPIIPRDTLVEYQWWKLIDFECQAELAAATAAPPPPLPEPEEPPISEEEQQAALDAEFATARDEGHRNGFTQGLQDGFERGRHQSKEGSKRITTLMQSIREAVDQLNGSVAEELIDLALQLTRRFLHGTLRAQPEHILPLIREVLSDAPTAPTPAMLRVHVGDAALIRRALGMELAAAGWTLIVDIAVKHSDCHVQTRFGEAGATLQTRWAELTRALDHDTAWLASEHAETEYIAGGAFHVA